MTKCICGVNISPDNVHYHQWCGKKIFQDSDMTLLSINEMVAENKQRAIPFPSYTGEVVDFLLASIDTLSEERDSFQRVGIKAMERAETAEADAKVYDNNFCVMEGLFIESQAENAALTKKVADLKFALVLASVGSCTCITKTDDYRFHGENCRYRIIQQALAATEKEK